MMMSRKSRFLRAITAAATAALFPRILNAATPDLAVTVRQEGYADSIDITQNGVTYPGSAYTFGFQFNVSSGGTEVHALDVALQADQAGAIRADGTTQPAGMSSAPVRLYSVNTVTGITTVLANVTVPSTDPISTLTTGGGPRPGSEAPRGPVITYTQYELPTPIIIYPAANTNYYVVTDVPKNYELYLGTDGYPGSAYADPSAANGGPWLATDPTITFDNMISSRTNNGYVPEPTNDYLVGNEAGYRGGQNVNMEVTSVVISTPANLTWTGASGDGAWDTSSLNFSNSSGGTVAYSDSSNTLGGDGDNVTFNDNNGGAAHYNVSIPTVVHPTSTIVSNSAGNYLFNGSGGIGGPGGLTKSGTSSLTVDTVNTYTGLTNISGGTLVLGVAGALPTGTNLNIAAGASVVASNLGSPVALSVGSLSISGSLDLRNNALVVHNSSIGAISALVASGYNGGGWNGHTGITSSAASADSTHLTTLGVIVNDNGSGTPLYGLGGTLATTFDGASPVDGDVLVKYTYYGDTSLKGYVNSSDYTRIDSSFLTEQSTNKAITGWANGDFNYDNVVNGSDYTLIDNAFNQQGSNLSAELASSQASATAQIAGVSSSSVPEPASLALFALGSACFLGRRRRRHCP